MHPQECKKCNYTTDYSLVTYYRMARRLYHKSKLSRRNVVHMTSPREFYVESSEGTNMWNCTHSRGSGIVCPLDIILFCPL